MIFSIVTALLASLMMVEPIGLAGTLIAIVQICGKVVSVCYEYRSGVKSAPREISLVLDEVTSVRNIIERLLNILDADDTSALPSLQSMNEPDAPLQKCLTELLDLKKSLKLEYKLKLKLKRSTLMWPLRRVDVEKRLAAIASIKATLQLAMSADNA